MDLESRAAALRDAGVSGLVGKDAISDQRGQPESPGGTLRRLMTAGPDAPHGGCFLRASSTGRCMFMRPDFADLRGMLRTQFRG